MKKIFSTLLTLILAFCLCFTLSACTSNEEKPTVDTCEHTDADNNGKCDECGKKMEKGPENPNVPENSDVHTHDLTKVDAISATCTEDGNIEYWSCSECKKLYSDENAIIEIALIDTVIAAAHKLVNSQCSECGYSYYTEGLEYELTEDGTAYTVIGIGTASDTNIIIPLTYNDLPVTSIGKNAFSECKNITGIIVSDSVTSIGYCAFEYCDKLTSVTIGKNVETIGNSAFLSCKSLTQIIFNATSMNDLSEDNNVFYKSGEDGEGINVIIGNNVTRIPDYLFCSYVYIYGRKEVYAPKIVTVKFEDGSICENIGNYAFKSCEELASITIPESVTSMGWSAFEDCSSIIIYCESASKPGGWDFEWNCSKNPVVWNCNNNDVADDGNIYTISDGIRYAFKDSCANVIIQPCNLTEANISETLNYKGVTYSVMAINERAFTYCKKLSKVTIPDSVISIGERAFIDLPHLSSVTIGNGVTTIGNSAFASCYDLTSVVIPDSVTSIGGGAFIYCTTLKSVTIGSGVKTIGSYAFYGCTKLTEINFNATLMNDFNADNIIFSEAGKLSAGINVTFGNNVTRIPTYLFCPKGASDSPHIKSVEFEKESVCKTIGDCAFFYCQNLASINIPDSVTSIGDKSFYGTGIRRVTIGSGVSTIGTSAFASCQNLSNLIMKSKVISIENSAFYYCTKLTDVYYIGTEEEWSALTVGPENTSLTNATIHYNWVEE